MVASSDEAGPTIGRRVERRSSVQLTLTITVTRKERKGASERSLAGLALFLSLESRDGDSTRKHLHMSILLSLSPLSGRISEGTAPAGTTR